MRDLFTKLPLIAAAVSATALTGADMDNRVSKLESEMNQVGTHTSGGTYGSNVASAAPQINSCGFYFGAGATLLQPDIEGTDFAITNTATSSTTVFSPVTGSVISVTPKTKWGVNIEAGYRTNHDGFDGKIAYTLVDNTSSSSITNTTSTSLIQTRASSALSVIPAAIPVPLSTVASAKASVLYRAHGVTADLGKGYFVSSNLSFRPSYGVQTLWSELSETVKYEGAANLSLVANESATVKDDVKFWGIGPRVATESKWHLGNGFSIFGDVAAAIAYGRFTATHTEEVDLVGTTNLVSPVDISKKFRTVVPVSDMSVGLSFASVVESDYYITAKIGYVARYNFRQNQSLKVASDISGAGTANTDTAVTHTVSSENSDIGVHGLVISASIDF